MIQSRHTLTVWIVLVLTSSLAGGEVQVTFSGTVLQTLANPYGKTIPVFAPVTGSFFYDDESLPTHFFGGDPHTVGYRQQKPAGFQVTFGQIAVSADEYIIAVSDDLPQPGGSSADIVSLRFSSDLDPALLSSLFVDGAAHSSGLLDVELVAAPSLLASTDLPSSFSFSDFNSNFGFLSQDPLGTDVFFVLNQLELITPEPTTVSIFATGLGIVTFWIGASRVRRQPCHQ